MNVRHVWAIAAVALAACHPAAPASTDRPPLAGSGIGGPFTLVDQDGRPRSDHDFQGRYRIMYFGYTYCPDVCPTDMQAVGAGLRELERSDPAIAAKVVPIFVTVDPTRDTAPVLKQFVSAFHPRMVGLMGSPEVLGRVEKEYGVYASKGPTQPGGGYLVNHGRQTYLFGPDGQPIALLPADEGPHAVADEIRRWVR